MESYCCRDCHETGPAETQQCFIPTQPDTNQKEDVCSFCGSANIIPEDAWWAEWEAKAEGER